MSTYLIEIEEAVSELLELAHRDSEVVDSKLANIARLEADFERARTAAISPEMWDDDTDPEREAKVAALKQSQASEARRELDNLRAALEARRISRSAIAGTLLQLGKQGISAVHGPNRGDAPTGYFVGGQPLRDVIWEGRNHAMHWEEGSPSANVAECFRQLELDFASPFELVRVQNLATEVLGVLGWVTFDDFRSSLQQLA